MYLQSYEALCLCGSSPLCICLSIFWDLMHVSHHFYSPTISQRYTMSPILQLWHNLLQESSDLADFWIPIVLLDLLPFCTVSTFGPWIHLQTISNFQNEWWWVSIVTMLQFKLHVIQNFHELTKFLVLQLLPTCTNPLVPPHVLAYCMP